MPLSAALPQISTNVRFAASRLLFPELAGTLAERLFLTPPRPRDSASAAATPPSECAITWRTLPWCAATAASAPAKSGSPVSLPSETPCAGWS